MAPHRQVRRSHCSIHCWHGHAARRSALPRERFSPLALFGRQPTRLTMSAHRVPDISTGNDGIVDGAHHMVPYNATGVTDIYAKQVLGDIVVTDDGLI